jgi:hypothetical protein
MPTRSGGEELDDNSRRCRSGCGGSACETQSGSYEYRVLHDDDALGQEVAEAVARDGRWTKFVEIRMAAGPNICIEALDQRDDSFRVSVTWGSQSATSDVIGLAGAVEVADRLAFAFYEIREKGPRQPS